MWLLFPYLWLTTLVGTVFLIFFVISRSKRKIGLKGKHVIVIGGSSGIGLALGELVLKEGATLTILARSARRLEAAVDYLTKKDSGAKARVFTYSVDASQPLLIRAAMELAVNEFGPVDVLICSQGISRPMRFEDLSEEHLKEVMDTNYWGCVHAIRAALPHMKQNRRIQKRISLISSQAGQVGVYGFSHYAATKFALRGLAEGLQQELLPYNIQMSLVCPPDTDTPQLVEENKTKHPVTKLLSSSSVSSAQQVARAALNGIKEGLFLISCNLEGLALSIATAGMAPQPSPLYAIVEILTAGIMRVVALITLSQWSQQIRTWHRRNSDR